MSDQQFVSRGGLKLQKALQEFKTEVKDKTILDVGSSTGGFVDCLLQNGAKKVYAVDTAYGEFAWKLRNDPKVVVMERTNILYLTELPEQVDVITIDASWTKLSKILPVVKPFLKSGGEIIALLKPHYENPQKTNKGVVPQEQVEAIVQKVIQELETLGFPVKEQTDSPILGGGGNKELLLHMVLS